MYDEILNLILLPLLLRAPCGSPSRAGRNCGEQTKEVSEIEGTASHDNMFRTLDTDAALVGNRQSTLS